VIVGLSSTRVGTSLYWFACAKIDPDAAKPTTAPAAPVKNERRPSSHSSFIHMIQNVPPGADSDFSILLRFPGGGKSQIAIAFVQKWTRPFLCPILCDMLVFSSLSQQQIINNYGS
jgi:hypothetical protein